ncbi:DUF4843 domain-containing protein [Sphingobacterium sp. HJSM2_6]|uniref:DUF4843 domain-containing protein n=1 Tax=Sphingobacterium sp. HJSM2_6 TaxID=3366264 RepID=UPI003BD5AD2E
MKNVTIKIYLLGICLLLVSCEKDLMKYEGEEGVYFAVQWGSDKADSTTWAFQSYSPVDFINLQGSQHQLKLRVMITGEPKSYDRYFGVELNSDSSTAALDVEYESFLTQYTIKAGTIYTDIPITLLRSENLQKEMRILGLNLIPSKDFSLSIPVWYHLPPHVSSERYKIFNSSYHKIELTDFITKPQVWFGGNAEGREIGLWGEFTSKKFKLFCLLNDLIYDDFKNSTIMHYVRVNVINQVMAAYLQNQMDKKTPVLEDDGRLMWVSGVSWNSIIGTPYKPVL